ncbi:hypothetical protein ACI48D_24820 [Massilia sp. LXY-6]|uniref:hypothetical protein n=1 Tax=Massilia sp. LXY-6 TaxID=3379823 RepID=UPI003EDED3BF
MSDPENLDDARARRGSSHATGRFEYLAALLSRLRATHPKPWLSQSAQESLAGSATLNSAGTRFHIGL